MSIRPVVYLIMKALRRRLVISSSQVKQEAGFDKPGLCCWNPPEISSRVSLSSL